MKKHFAPDPGKSKSFPGKSSFPAREGNAFILRRSMSEVL